MSNKTTKKLQNILLENKCKQIEKNGNKVSNIIAFIYHNFNNQGQKLAIDIAINQAIRKIYT